MAKEYNGAPAVFGAEVPDMFIDDVTGLDMINGTLRFDLATFTRIDPIPQSDIKVSVIGRLIMPVEAAQRLSIMLYDYLKQRGLDPNAVIGGESEAKPN